MITIALVFKFGLIGAAIGTLVAMVYHTCYFVWYLQKNILERSVKYFIGFLLTDVIVAVASCILTRGFGLYSETYVAWLILALKVSGIVLLVSIIVHLIAYRSQIKTIILLLKRR